MIFFHLIVQFSIFKFDYQEWRNIIDIPQETEREGFSYDQKVKNIFKLFNSVVYNYRKEIGGYTHAEI